MYTHGIFSAQVELLKQTYGIEPGEIDLCTFPLFALFAPSSSGMTCVISGHGRESARLESTRQKRCRRFGSSA